MDHKDEEVAEARDKAIEKAVELLGSNNYNVQLVAIQAILNYDLQLRTLKASGPGELHPTPWPSLQRVV